MKERKNDPTKPDWERQLEDQSDGRWHEAHDTISSGLINEHYHQRERAIQAIDSANLLPAQVRNEWQRSLGKINLILESTGTGFDALISQVDDYVEGAKQTQFLLADPFNDTYLLQKHQIEPIISAVRNLKETYFRFQRKLDPS